MSKALHKHYRKLLEVRLYNAEYMGQKLHCKTYIWAAIESETSRTIKSSHIGFTTYINGEINSKGIAARFSSKKLYSINIKQLLDSKCFQNNDWQGKYGHIERAINQSFNSAYQGYITQPTRSKGLKGTMLYFDNSRGEGCIACGDLRVQLYACNAIGKKTWYPETACINFERGQEVVFDLADMGDHVTASNVQGGTFDASKWASLPQDRLAFKCDENGDAINGLFAK